MTLGFQAVVLAGGLAKRFGVLSENDTPKALLPVGNRPLLSYSLDALEKAGFTDITLVVAGDVAAKRVKSYMGDTHRSTHKVVEVAEEVGSASALRSVIDRLTADNVLVVSGDLISDVVPEAVVKSHLSRAAPAATCLIGARPLGNPEERESIGGKPVKPDFIGICEDRLLFLCSGTAAGKEVRVRRSLLNFGGQVALHTDLQDAHLYIFSRTKLAAVLDEHPNMTSIKEHVLPYMARRQFARRKVLPDPEASPAPGQEPERQNSDQVGDEGEGASKSMKDEAEDKGGKEEGKGDVGAPAVLPLSTPPGEPQGGVYVELVAQDKYVMRVNSLATYIDANRDVAAPGVAAHLTGFTVSKYDNVVDPTAELGQRATIGPGCIVGAQCVLGDKSSIRRTVLGRGTKLGNNVKVINSVVGENVIISDGCHVQGSVVAANAVLEEKCSLRDCQVAAGYVVTANVEYRSEELAN